MQTGNAAAAAVSAVVEYAFCENCASRLTYRISSSDSISVEVRNLDPRSPGYNAEHGVAKGWTCRSTLPGITNFPPRSMTWWILRSSPSWPPSNQRRQYAVLYGNCLDPRLILIDRIGLPVGIDRVGKLLLSLGAAGTEHASY